MLPLLSIMVGLYIITRMLHLILDKKELSIVTTVFAGITMLATVYCVYQIVQTGAGIASLLPEF